MRRNREAFTKKWALFCAGKQFTEKDLVYRSRIIKDGDFRRNEYERASVRFCSVLNTNLSESRIRNGGDFLGNGWYECHFSGAEFRGLVMDREEYRGCFLGNSVFCRVRMTQIRAKGCNYAGSRWEAAEFNGCTFRECSFRGAVFTGGYMSGTVFWNCVFDKTDMSGLEMRDVTFRECRFYGWTEEKTNGCIFLDCTFEKY